MRRLPLFMVAVLCAVGLSASVATADGCACGGQVYQTYVLVTWPAWAWPTAYCERHYSNGGVTYGPC